MSRWLGLSREEAARRLRADGPNELPTDDHRHLLKIAWELLREPMILLLIACGTIYLGLGNAREALLLLSSIAVIVGIELFQKRKAERAVDALRALSSPRALVIRDGERTRIPGREVVRGDLVVLVEGARVPADGLVRAGTHLLVDESLLTGESVSVRKSPTSGTPVLDRPGGDGLPSVFSGTLVVGGEGVAETVATGPSTAMGRIGASLRAITSAPTRLQREIARLVQRLAWVGLLLCLIVAVLSGLTRGNWLHGLLAGLTLAISMVPEELPVVLTVFLALGAWRLSRHQVLTRHVPAVEMLGSATVLCADKTGTVTMNRMAAQQLWADGAAHDVEEGAGPLPEACQALAAISILASRREPFDPTEQALHRLAGRVRPERLRSDWTLVHARPLSNALLAVVHVWRSPDGRQQLIAAKGAPEAIARLCRLPSDQAARLARATEDMAARGLRVLGVASAVMLEGARPEARDAPALQWLGLVGLADPVRPSVPAAIRECREAGIRVVMVTGDYPATAQHIARQIGLAHPDDVVTGPALDGMDAATLSRRLRDANVFARIAPEQKLRIVEALKANGEIVAMTGDGVNDAPALKAAHIGIAMGGRGTDVAREAAAVVLLDDEFSSIVQAIRVGRRIVDNLKKATAYLLAVHVPIAGMSLLPVMLHWPLVLLPVHIVFLELIIDPACSIAFEAEPMEAGAMQRPPRSAREPLVDRRSVRLSVLQGASVLVTVLAVFLITLARGNSEAEARAMTVTSLILGNLALIFTNRSWSRTILHSVRTPNPALWWITGGAVGVLGVVLYLPGLRELFHFAPLHPDDLALCLIAGLAGIAWFELLKWWLPRRAPR